MSVLLRKITLLLIGSIFAFEFSRAQIPINLGSWQEFDYQYNHIEDSISHLALRPYFIALKQDTFILKPVSETYLQVSPQGFSGVLGGGMQLQARYGRWSFAGDLLTGTGFKPAYWKYPALPFVGKYADILGQQVFFDPRVYLGFNAGLIKFELGREKFHIGQGYRSLWLDNYAPALPYFGARVDVWRLEYRWRIHYLQNPDFRFPNKEFFHAYLITHYFDFSFGRLNINMFETVVQDPIDSLGARRGFDFFNYINPVIFYRAVDLSLGSPDNVLLGLGGSLRLWKSTVLYGYGVLDELIVSHLLAGDNCWCLKYGLNAGVKTYNFLNIRGLFVQAEASLVRPYTYSHDNPILAYGNLYQPLAHPLGANFYEGLGRILYKSSRLAISTEFIAARYGDDIDTLNYGRNIFRSYLTRVADMGVRIGQGRLTDFLFVNVKIERKTKIFNVPHWLSLSFGAKVLRSKGQMNFYPFLGFGLSNGILNWRNDWQ